MISSLSSLDLNTTTAIAFGQYTNITSNNSTNESYYGAGPVFPAYIRPTATVLCSLIMGIGVLGNVMVPIVIFKSKDMRNSTNVFLMNLSFADLMVLLVCTPTVLVEVNSRPETWVLGEEMCKAVPFIEMMVTHASVLTILAISFERYYAICEPLKAGYICTKTRAFFICLCAWLLAGLLTSPMLFIPEYGWAPYYDGSKVPVCLMPADTFWRELFFYMSSSLFFWVPLVVLLILYTVIGIHLMADPGIKGSETFSHRARSQLVLMLAAVVVSFFLCLMPFRVFILWYISASAETIKNLGIEKYFNILYFCRTITYVHSAINPILYNLMSSKFRDGFMRVCGLRTGRLLIRRHRRWGFTNSLNTTTTSLSYSSTRRERDHFGSAHYHFRESPDLRGTFRESRTLSRKDLITSPRNSKTPGDISPILIYLSRKNTAKSNVSDASSKISQEKNEKESYESLIGHEPQAKRISSSCSESLRLSQYGDLSDNSNSHEEDPEARNSVALSEYDNVEKGCSNVLEFYPDKITCRILKSNSEDDILKIITKKNPPDRGKGSPEGSRDTLVPITKVNENEVPGLKEVSFSSCRPPHMRNNSIRRSILKSRINQRLTNDCTIEDEPPQPPPPPSPPSSPLPQVLNGSLNKSKDILKNSDIIKCSENSVQKNHPESHV